MGLISFASPGGTARAAAENAAYRRIRLGRGVQPDEHWWYCPVPMGWMFAFRETRYSRSRQ
jgi:hypothetical protein